MTQHNEQETDEMVQALFEELADGGVNWEQAWLAKNNPELRQRYMAVVRIALRKSLAARTQSGPHADS